jgi:hypothetical protein
MKSYITIFAISALISLAAVAVEVDVPGVGRINISNGVVTVPEGTNVADGEYKVTVEGKEVTLVFTAGKGSIKQ